MLASRVEAPQVRAQSSCEGLFRRPVGSRQTRLTRWKRPPMSRHATNGSTPVGRGLIAASSSCVLSAEPSARASTAREIPGGTTVPPCQARARVPAGQPMLLTMRAPVRDSHSLRGLPAASSVRAEAGSVMAATRLAAISAPKCAGFGFMSMVSSRDPRIVPRRAPDDKARSASRRSARDDSTRGVHLP